MTTQTRWVTHCPDSESWLSDMEGKWKVVDGGCREWQARLDRHGYGKFRFKDGDLRRFTGAHRAMWLAVRGDIPEGMVLDHLCRNRACVNVEHMELVTGRTNTRRGFPGRKPAGCQVHGYGDGYHAEGRDGYSRWTCRTCRRERVNAWRLKKRAA